MITPKTYRALKILEAASFAVPMTANTFALHYWGKDKQLSYIFTAYSSGGNGSQAGKKAWLCAGSYLSKLRGRGLVKWRCRYSTKTTTGYYLSDKGREAIRGYEQQGTLAKIDI